MEQCQQVGRIWGQELYLDATQVKANASLNSLAPRFAVEAHLTTLFTSPDPSDPPPNPAVQHVADLRPRAEVPSDLAEHNTQRHTWVDETGQPDRSIRRGSYRRRSDFEASQTDPDAALMAHKRGGLHTGYHDHVVVDGGKARIIVAMLVTPADVMENQPALDLLWRACFRWHLKPHQVTADTTYATGENIRAIEAAGIRATPSGHPAAGRLGSHGVLWTITLHLRC